MAEWDDSRGDWQGLSDPSQSPRYHAIADLIARFAPGSQSVLDVGCGEAVLARFLPSACMYTGVEPSTAALKGAGQAVIHSTAENFSSVGRAWDAIVFNEMLYYTGNPAMLLEKYTHLLNPKGLYVISIYQRRAGLRERVHQALRLKRNRNLACTRLVDQMMQGDGWRLCQGMAVPIPGTGEFWRLWAATRLRRDASD